MIFWQRSFLAKRQQLLKREIGKIQYQIGSNWYPAVINSKTIQGTTLTLILNLPAYEAENTITGLKIYDWEGDLAGQQALAIVRTAAQSTDLKLLLTLQESSGELGFAANSGYLLLVDSVSKEVNLQMEANLMYQFTNEVSRVELSFATNSPDQTSEYLIQFKTGNSLGGFGVTVPSSVTWVPAEPIWEANKTYTLAFVPVGAGYNGLWLAD